MSVARVYSAQTMYLSAVPVTVEADVSRESHTFTVVGLADKAIEESRERVCAAIKNSGLPSPKHSDTRIVVSLAPADLRKEGPRFDLPIALAYLLAAGEISFDPTGILFVGELSLEGALRPVRGILSLARFAADAGYHTLVVPKDNAREAALVSGITVLPADRLIDVLGHFDTTERPGAQQLTPQEPTPWERDATDGALDLGHIRGQDTAKRGLEIAAAGRHNIVLYGPPGTGKTMLARALAGILPPLSFDEALEATAIHSIAGVLEGDIIHTPPFRALAKPHWHTAVSSFWMSSRNLSGG